MPRTKIFTDVLETLKKLPYECYAVLPSEEGRLIRIIRGIPGYVPHTLYGTDEQAQKVADQSNAELGVSGPQVEAMKCGSMFGWHVPGADPDRHK